MSRVEPARPFTIDPNGLVFRRPFPDEVEGIKVVYFGFKKPIKNYLVMITNIVAAEGRVLLKARGNAIPRLLLALICLEFRPHIQKIWLWKELGSSLYPAVAVLLTGKRRLSPPALHPGDRLRYEAGRWIKVQAP